MDIQLRQAIVDAVRANKGASFVISNIDFHPDGTGTITYNPKGVWIDPSAPGFSGTSVPISDEEAVRAYLVAKLATAGAYPASPHTLEIERVYKPVGRPIGKGGRIDLLVRRPPKNEKLGNAFLFIEVKSPSSFDSDLRLIDGQLFRLSLQETPRPRYLVYFTTEFKAGSLRDRVILIDTGTFSKFEAWDKAGQPIVDTLPVGYGMPPKRRFANVDQESETLRPLDKFTTPETFNRIRSEIHDVIWGGGGTNNNEVFVYITKLILCKIFDEKETPPGKQYRFQRLGDAVEPETPAALVERMNCLYREAEATYLALPEPSAGPAFDTTRIAAEKISYVVGRLEGLSITENVYHDSDLLGEFFEQIVAQDFTQTRGQFFTPVRLVRFMVYLAAVVEQARDIMLHVKDHLGRPRLPYVIDPACGSGTFLIEYMKLIRKELGGKEVRVGLPRRIGEAHEIWFSGPARSAWAREYLFGIENNYDLGLAAKVNMVLHGDGSMNTWIMSALLPFQEYWVEGRNNVLGVAQPARGHSYGAERNEQFDLIVSNPPFSLRMPPDEKAKIKTTFAVMTTGASEAIFIERWYQLLRDGGSFCCILPEAILDTATSLSVRLFLLQHFVVRAVVSLPYDAFRPFTSSKTCIVLATKRRAREIAAWNEVRAKITGEMPDIDGRSLYEKVVGEVGWDEEPIFMAEPNYVGYKRRKNLPDLQLPNELYQEDMKGHLVRVDPENRMGVLDYFFAGLDVPRSPTLGFWTNLKAITAREGLRLDPKYRWLWDYQKGLVRGNPAKAVRLRELLTIVDLPRVAKGELDSESQLIDLEYVESRQAIVRDDVPAVDVVGSGKVRFSGCDLAIAKLEPYLGKIIVQPPEVLGSTEWVGLRIISDVPVVVMAYLLMLPEMCEAYRRLQSGKRHARFDPKEFLDLLIEVPDSSQREKLAVEIEKSREEIFQLRRRSEEVRRSIDELFGHVFRSS